MNANERQCTQCFHVSLSTAKGSAFMFATNVITRQTLRYVRYSSVLNSLFDLENSSLVFQEDKIIMYGVYSRLFVLTCTDALMQWMNGFIGAAIGIFFFFYIFSL